MRLCPFILREAETHAPSVDGVEPSYTQKTSVMMLEQTPSRHIDPSQCFVYPIGEGWLIYRPEFKRLGVINNTAKIVWDLVNDGYEEDEIASLFIEHYCLSATQAREDVAVAVAGLEQFWQVSLETVSDDSAFLPSKSQLGESDTDYLNTSADLGSYRFGNSVIQIRSAVSEVNTDYLRRFEQRRISTGAIDAVLDISRDCLRFRGKTIPIGHTSTDLMAAISELLFGLEHPDIEFLVYFHAAALSYGRKSLLLSGSSGKGKSTLTAYLAANGFAYLSDDLVAITETDRTLRPLPNRLSLKTGSWPIMEVSYPGLPTSPPVDCHGRIARYVDPPLTKTVGPAPSVILFPCYAAHEETQLNPCPPLQAMAQLFEANVDLAKPVTEAKLSKFIRFVEETPAYELRYSDLLSALKNLEHLLETTP